MRSTELGPLLSSPSLHPKPLLSRLSTPVATATTTSCSLALVLWQGFAPPPPKMARMVYWKDWVPAWAPDHPTLHGYRNHMGENPIGPPFLHLQGKFSQMTHKHGKVGMSAPHDGNHLSACQQVSDQDDAYGVGPK